MNHYKKFAFVFIGLEIVLMIACNMLLSGRLENHADREYRVEIQRAAEKMRSGTAPEQISLKDYKTIMSISEFKPEQGCRYDYMVEEINGTLYRFEYTQDTDTNDIWFVNIILGIFLLGTVYLLVYIGKKVIRPFYDMSELTKELAKGNLSIPVKEEKNKFFGSFLWGIDMLREKLELDKARELELVKEKKMLLLSLSHDIRTPLSAIDLYTKALSQNLYEDEEKKLEALLGIEKNTVEIRKYVNEVVKASREDFLSLEVVNGEFYISELMDSITKYYGEKLKRIHTEFTAAEVRDGLLYGDLNRTIEVLQNVMENALKYGDGEKIQISVDEEEGCKLVTVTNSGCSLKKEELTHIFDSFYRGSNSEGIAGSGLGLYICKEILHKMDGEIFAKQENDSFAVTVVLRKL